MALHGLIQVNDYPIGAWTARRTTNLMDESQVSTYECAVQWTNLHREPGVDGETDTVMRFTVRHKYSDGAVALAAKVLSRATQ